MLSLEDYNSGLIYTEVSGCIDCNKCIHECPILKSNVSVLGGDGAYKMCVDERECILCGTCIDTCIHDVRHYKDDCGDFFLDIERGGSFSVLVAPAFYLNYPDEYKHVFGYLKSLGVKNFYSVGFGADIATWGYLNYITKNDSTGNIAQPCPTIVSHIEKHMPELLPDLIPVQSPMMCLSIYLKKYKNIREDLVFLSPCIAKKIEIQSERGMGLVKYNVTFKSLMERIRKNGVDLRSYPAAADTGDYGMGSLFPKPGGLSDNVEYYLGHDTFIVRVEGERESFEYLGSFAGRAKKAEDMPVLVDVLNCAKGCNYGTGTEFRDILDDNIHYQTHLMRKKKFPAMTDGEGNALHNPRDRFARLNEIFKDLKLEDFMCGYAADDVSRIPPANEEEIENIFREKLMKLTENDKHVDCAACGYDTCRLMAEAIALGINHHDNCVYYTKNALANSMEELRVLENVRLMEQRLKAVIDTSPILCSIFDEDLTPIDINQAGVNLLELPDKQTYTDRFYELCPEYQPDGTTTRDKLIQMASLALDKGSAKFEWMHQTLNGETLIPCEGYLERVEFGEKPLLFAYVRDLREQNAVLAQLEGALGREQSANRAKSRFLSNMSHEIRTPMNAILGITEIQLRNTTITGETEEALLRIHNSSNLLLALINNLLDLSKIEAEKMEIIVALYDMASLIVDTVQMNFMYIGSKRVEFLLDVDPELPSMLIGDELRIKQVLNNILSNAFKYTEEGTVTAAFGVERIESDEDQTLFTITIRDTGRGMSKEQVDRLFTEEYLRFDEGDNIEGTGLGTTIAYHLVEMMDGTIEVESEPGKGTQVMLRIPQKLAGKPVLGEEQARNLQKFKTMKTLLERSGNSVVYEPMPYGRVLVVDDMESNLYVAKGLLVPYKLTLETAGSGQAAINKVEAGEVYDVIFMDHMMPEMDGIEATKILRGMGYDRPIVALTANALVGQNEMFMRNGFSGFISKPIDTRLLDACLKQFVRDMQPPEVIKSARAMSGQPQDGQDVSSKEEVPIEPLLRDGDRILSTLETIMEQGDFEAGAIKKYTIQVHSAKNLLRNIGEAELADIADALEQAGRKSDIDVIRAETPPFLAWLKGIIGALASELPAEQEADEEADEHPAFLREKLLATLAACESFNANGAKDIIAELNRRPRSKRTKKLLDDIEINLLRGYYDEAAELARHAAETMDGILAPMPKSGF